jgi:hypothetical protein
MRHHIPKLFGNLDNVSRDRTVRVLLYIERAILAPTFVRSLRIVRKPQQQRFATFEFYGCSA